MSHSGFKTLPDQLRNAIEDDGNVNKPDFRELDLGSPVSPLRTTRSSQPGGTNNATTTTTTTTSSSSSSSGSVTGRNNGPTSGPVHSHLTKRSESNNHSGELSGSVESSPTGARSVAGSTRGRHVRSNSCGSHHLIYSGGPSGGTTSPAVNSPAPNVLPAGNICPSGKGLKTGMMSNRTSKTEVLGSGTVNYGHGSIMRGGAPTTGHHGSSGAGMATRGLVVGGEPMKRIPKNTTDPEDLKRLGNEHYKKGNFSEALNFYDKAIAIAPTNAAYHCNRAAALMGLKRLVEAVQECLEAIKSDPGYSRAHHRLGSLFLSLGQVENARKHLTDPIELQKLQAIERHINKCYDARRINDWRTMLRESDLAIASGADSSPQLFASRAEALLKLHQTDDAIITLSNMSKFEISPSSCKFFGMFSEAYPYFVRCQIELTQGRFENALTAIEKAGQIDPRNIEVTALLNKLRMVSRARARGNDLFKSERFTEACSAYAEGLKLDPLNSVLYCNRAACWFKLRQWERSLEDCNQALYLQPNYTKALLRRAACYTKLERWNESVRDYEALRKELPYDNELAENLFHAQVSLKKSRGEEVYNMKFGGEVEVVLGIDQFRAAISSPTASVVHFKSATNLQCKQISSFLDTLCTRYPSINFLKVDVEDSPGIANAENVRIVPTFKIYKNGTRVKEMICPSPEVLESSVRHYSI